MNKVESAKLDKKVLEALNEKCPPSKHWDYINHLIAYDLIGPHYVPSNRYASRVTRAKSKHTDEEIYNEWVKREMPPQSEVAKHFGLALSTVSLALSRHIENSGLHEQKENTKKHQGKSPKLWGNSLHN